MSWKRVFVACSAVLAGAGAGGAAAAGPTTLPAEDAARLAARRTPLVRLFEACRPSVVTVTVARKGSPAGAPESRPAGESPPSRAVTHTERGSGFVIHSDGYVLTVAHVLRYGGRCRAYRDDGRGYRAEVVARDDTLDLALLKLDSREIFQPIKLARSDDLMVGERAVVLGNPFGFGLTLGAGVITGLDRKTKTDFTFLTNVIQTDAGICPGVSGGPVVNAFGEVVGMAVSRREDAQSIGFATTTDTIRAAFPALLAPEERYGFVLGLQATPGLAARVTHVEPQSPADEAQVRVHDVITAVEGRALRTGIDFYLSLVGREGGQKLRLRLLRKHRPVDTVVTLGAVPFRPAVEPGPITAGLNYRAYRGKWKALPDFDRLKPAASGTTKTFGPGTYREKDRFALVFTGYVEVPADGVYAFYTRSDDGSRLYLGDRLVVDNDAVHGSVERRGFAALRAGLHPIRVTFFDADGEEELTVCYEGPGLEKRPIPENVLFRPKDRPAPEPETRSPSNGPK